MVFYPTLTPGRGYGGTSYGYSRYGRGFFRAPPVAVDSGYGGYEYGLSSYGSLDIDPPRVSSALSIDGYHLEVFFTKSMQDSIPLVDPTSYMLTPLIGAPSNVQAVAYGTFDGVGYTSVVLTHSGTTLGGNYQVTVATDLADVIGNTILPTANSAYVRTLGETPSYTVTPTDGRTIRVSFSENILPETSFSPGVLDPASYDITTDYPIGLDILAIAQPSGSIVDITVQGMTSTNYDILISNASAIVYDGTYLPSAGTTFTGVSVGTGSSTASSQLLLTKIAGNTYGWAWEDITGKIQDNSSYRVEFTCNPSGAIYVPSLYDTTLGTLVVSDSVTQISISLSRVSGIDVLDVVSGAYTAQVPASWSTDECVITWIRNQKADCYALLFNGVSLLSVTTASLNGVPTIDPGVQFALGTAYAVTQFPISAVTFTASQTVFSNSWNFLHDVGYSFIGSNALTRPVVMTKHGPLVKSWGDNTPATKNDVSVRVNGVIVDIDSVNPYIGSITPTIPIPLTPQNSGNTVDVDYTWMPSPVMQMTGLNTLGLVLNAWSQQTGRKGTANGSGVGVAPTSRFPISVVLPYYTPNQPKLIGHRYLGFERAYTAALNSPTTLLLNQNPHVFSRGKLKQSKEDVAYSYEGRSAPSLTWRVTGTDSGYVGTGSNLGYYVLDNTGVASYPTGDATFYYRQEDFSYPCTGQIAVRMNALDYTLDGVFSGLGFGLHNNRHLYLVGFLEINGLRHVGLLVDPEKPYAQESWQIGPSFSMTLTGSSQFETTDTAFISLALRGGASGLSFQILDGLQAGVYTITQCGVHVNASETIATVTIEETFPVDVDIEGGKYATGYSSLDWLDRTYTYRIVSNVQQGTIQVYLGGSVSGLVIESSNVPAYPAQTSLILPTTKRGTFFWGSLSRNATNTSRWAFVRYGVSYDQSIFTFQGIVVAAEMGVTPDMDANHPWFVTEDFGRSYITSGNDLLLDSNTASETIDTNYGFSRIEPFLTDKVLTDVDTWFRVDSSSSGISDAQVIIRNGKKQVTFGTLAYLNEIGGHRLVQMPSPVCISALQLPTAEGWTALGTGTASILENRLVVGSNAYWTNSITSTTDMNGGRVFEARFKVESGSTGISLTTGPRIGGRFGSNGRDIEIAITDSPKRVRVLSGGSSIAVYSLNWGDGAYHTYRAVCDESNTTVSIYVDDVLQGTLPYASFTALGNATYVRFGNVGTATCTTTWESMSVSVGLPTNAKRTIGVLVGADTASIDSWSIPRTDSSTDPNSSINATIEEMNWSSLFKTRIRLDPQWGVTVFRPDLPPPPYYTGDFATEYTEPSAGWINVEYASLPNVEDVEIQYGLVSFGAIKPESVTQQHWKSVRYRIYTAGSDNLIAPQHMVLNYANVITSGELNNARTLESVVVESLDATHISLQPSHIYAARVYTVIVENTVLSSDVWSFNPTTQIITLNTALPNAHMNVTVNFVAGKPVTNTYLCSQPLMQSNTLLNEGTPIVPLSQTGTDTRVVTFGSQINDPTDTLGDPDFIMNDSFRQVGFENNNLYNNLETCTVDNGGDAYISMLCDLMGLVSIGMDGTMFSDQTTQVGGPGRGWGSMTMRDSVGNFNQVNQMVWVGGRTTASIPQGAYWNTGIMYPSFPNGGGVIKALSLYMRVSAVITDGASPEVETALEDNYSGFSDATPPSEVAGVDPNPDGTPATNGACIVEMTDYVTTTYSRWGPWGGSYALSLHSNLAGGSVLAGNEFTWSGGSSLGAGPTITVTNVVAP